MKPITVYDAKPGEPFALRTQVKDVTVRDMRDAFDKLCQMGYGGTSVIRADVEAGPCMVTALELYDTSEENTRGECLSDMAFLIC